MESYYNAPIVEELTLEIEKHEEKIKLYHQQLEKLKFEKEGKKISIETVQREQNYLKKKNRIEFFLSQYRERKNLFMKSDMLKVNLKTEGPSFELLYSLIDIFFELNKDDLDKLETVIPLFTECLEDLAVYRHRRSLELLNDIIEDELKYLNHEEPSTHLRCLQMLKDIDLTANYVTLSIFKFYHRTLSFKKMMVFIECLILVAEKCKKHGDLHGFISIFSGLTALPISRIIGRDLPNFQLCQNRYLSRTAQSLMEKLSLIASPTHGSSQLRKCMLENTIPHLGVYLRDMTLNKNYNAPEALKKQEKQKCIDKIKMHIFHGIENRNKTTRIYADNFWNGVEWEASDKVIKSLAEDFLDEEELESLSEEDFFYFISLKILPLEVENNVTNPKEEKKDSDSFQTEITEVKKTNNLLHLLFNLEEKPRIKNKYDHLSAEIKKDKKKYQRFTEEHHQLLEKIRDKLKLQMQSEKKIKPKKEEHQKKAKRKDKKSKKEKTKGASLTNSAILMDSQFFRENIWNNQCINQQYELEELKKETEQLEKNKNDLEKENALLDDLIKNTKERGDDFSKLSLFPQYKRTIENFAPLTQTLGKEAPNGSRLVYTTSLNHLDSVKNLANSSTPSLDRKNSHGVDDTGFEESGVNSKPSSPLQQKKEEEKEEKIEKVLSYTKSSHTIHQLFKDGSIKKEEFPEQEKPTLKT